MGAPPPRADQHRHRLIRPILAALLAAAAQAACSDDRDSTAPSTTAATSSTAVTADDVIDACELVADDDVARVTGRAVTTELLVAVGGGTTCDHRPVDAPQDWTISVFVFERDTEGNDIDARDAFTRFRAESGEPVDVPDLGDDAFSDVSGRVGVLVGGAYVDVTAVRFDDLDALVEIARVAVDSLRG